MKARIYTSEIDFEGIVISGNVKEFRFGTEGWNMTLENSKTAEENAEFYDVIEERENNKLTVIKECHRMSGPRSRAVIEDNGYAWIGFNFESGYRVSLFTEKERV